MKNTEENSGEGKHVQSSDKYLNLQKLIINCAVRYM
jgi:hypothetical protein